MNILPISQISFQKMHMQKTGDYKMPKDFNYVDNTGKKHELVFNKQLDDSVKILRKEDLIIPDPTVNFFRIKDNKVYGIYMFSKDRYKGTGSVFHLAKIIEMLENECSEIDINSLNSAIIFHAKNGFRGNLHDQIEAHYALTTIVNSFFLDDKFIDISADAAELMAKQDYSLDKVNKIFTEFLEIAVKLPKDVTDKIYFRDTADQTLLYGMKLTKDDVIKNKDFYNNLFEKHKIDYKID